MTYFLYSETYNKKTDESIIVKVQVWAKNSGAVGKNSGTVGKNSGIYQLFIAYI
jgi:hypothetical protein